LRLSQREVPLGFQIRLLEFGNPTYGGTGMAARYYSTVDVSPTDKPDLVEKHTISMNQPLVMNGFRLFQSSYYQDPDGTSVSVLSVSRDPGVPLVYSGSCLLIVGIALTFYLPRQRTGAAQNG
ncbi:MAG TPA: cytochrome c biogenesis protein ResB, partial [bacterium]|nr:cytochrome c biogenesis protein ResB [bacterium]